MIVVVPFDGSPASQNALEYVIRTAASLSRENVEVDLVNVQEPSRFTELFQRDAADAAERIDTFCRESGARLLAEPVARLKEAGIPTQSVVLIGDPAPLVANYVENNGCDAVVMGTRGMGPVGGLLLGSVAYKVIHLVKVPVTLVK